VWRSWTFDFYVDITNAAVMPEELRAGEAIHDVLPTIGTRGPVLTLLHRVISDPAHGDTLRSRDGCVMMRAIPGPQPCR
jgi:hypothetical protein